MTAVMHLGLLLEGSSDELRAFFESADQLREIVIEGVPWNQIAQASWGCTGRQHRLYFRPLWHGHSSFRPGLCMLVLQRSEEMSTARAGAALHAAFSSWAESVKRPASCLFCCHHRIWWNGFWTRTATTCHDEGPVWVQRFRIRRVKCASCRRSWGLRPPGLFPHRHYQLGAIAEAAGRWLYEPTASLGTAAARIACSPRSVRRWCRWLAAITSPPALLRRVLQASDEPVQLRCPEVTDLDRKATTTLGRELLVRAGQVLGLLEVLAAATRLEPPGLQAVLLRVVGDRAHRTTDRSPFIPEHAWSQVGGPSASLSM